MLFTSEYGKPRHAWRENWQAAFLFSRCRKGLWTSVQLTILLQNKWSTSSTPRTRPEKMNEDGSPFYLAVNKNVKAESLQTKELFKVGPVGINKLNGLMKTMAQKAGINNERLRNHSGRKTMIQTLSENDIPLTHIAQLSGQQGLDSQTADENVSSS